MQKIKDVLRMHLPGGVDSCRQLARTVGCGKSAVADCGLPASKLIPWLQLKDAAHISRDTRLGLKMSAKDIGSNPMNWYGSLHPVPIETCVIERLDDGNFWVKP
jgi:hypothetical protein